MVGTGGYASYPMVKAAARAGIPTAVHESNMVPGLTTKMLESYADVIMVGFEDCRQHYKHPSASLSPGTPVRGDFFRLSREEARKKLCFDDEAPLVVSFWGSLGASHMNECMVDFFRREDAEGYPFRHIHAVGKGGWEAMEQKLRELGLPKSDRLDVRQYIYDMDVVMAAADVVLCRAGASTISELTGAGQAHGDGAVTLCDQQPSGEERAAAGKARRRGGHHGAGEHRRRAVQGRGGHPLR